MNTKTKQPKKIKKVKLPDKPSELILLALKDLAAVEKQKDKYKIGMDTSWHDPNGKCTVCFAGSVMANTFKADPKMGVNSDMKPFSARDWQKFHALDSFRNGYIAAGLDYIGTKKNTYDLEEEFYNNYYDFPEYDEDKVEWTKAMKRIVKFLASKGL